MFIKLTGPYYRYRTFNDFTQFHFRKNVKHEYAVMEKLEGIYVLAAIYFISNYIWPLSVNLI